MVRRVPGCPQSTLADRVRRQHHRNVRRLHLDFEGSHLCAAAADLAARGLCRSLWIQHLADNASLLLQGRSPWYRLVLFGKPGYFVDDEPPPPDGYIIIVTESDDEDGDY